MGIPIIASSYVVPVPKFRMSEKCEAMFKSLGATHHVKEFDKWSREFFGENDQFYVINNPITKSKTILVSHKIYDDLFQGLGYKELTDTIRKLRQNELYDSFAYNSFAYKNTEPRNLNTIFPGKFI